MKSYRRFAVYCLRWIAVWSLLLTTTAMENSTSIQLSINGTGSPELGYTWSSWSRWSPCSRSCGGGVSVQNRSCIPRTGNVTVDTSPSSRFGTKDCAGPLQRYHECNTAPCPGEQKNLRSEQCSAYDRRPFRGRYYIWIPYVDGDSPCTLNCRPLGQQFYASLGIAADGTPCTKPGFRAICVQGTCKVVGRSAVLASNSAREVRCGRRLVSGLFSRPRLPLGYSLVATVPRGACRLNVSEMLPSDNYIALKVTNGSFIMNGEFAVSATGSYDAVGTRFQYNRIGALDTVFAYGPLQQSIDIMILYTQPNPNIKYEYLTESLPGETNIETQTEENILTTPFVQTKHIRRHHNVRIHNQVDFEAKHGVSREDTSYSIEDNFVNSRTFVWKILNFTPCSRSCGGGFQLGKYKCVETSSNGQDREVSPVHCSGSPPPGRRKRCGTGQCPPRWRTTAWSPCPRCGPAERRRIVGCVQDHSKGIAKVSDQKCPAPKPIVKDICDIPDCHSSFEHKQIIVTQSKRREQVDSFQDGPIYTVVQSVNGTEDDVGPEYSFSSAGGWLYTDWSECVGWCVGGAIQTRGVMCGDPAGCAPRKAPETTQLCSAQLTCEPFDGQWFTGEWSVCSSPCNGRRVRGALCVGGTGRHLKDSACKSPKPEVEQECGDECVPSWFLGDWSPCLGSCEQGSKQRRTVYCARADNVPASDTECPSPRPQAQRTCTLERCLKTDGSGEIGLESQRIARNEIILTPITTTVATTTESFPKDCVDKLINCALAVQARLCHYNYYIQNCCNSCRR